MIDLNKHTIEIIKPESIQSLRESQINNRYIIPSDYVYFLLKYGKMKFEKVPFFNFNNNRYEFFEFYDLENLNWQIKDKRKSESEFNEIFWPNDFLCIGQLDDKRILVGIDESNINEIHLYDNEQIFIDNLNVNLFEFINEKLTYD